LIKAKARKKPTHAHVIVMAVMVKDSPHVYPFLKHNRRDTIVSAILELEGISD
jgi:hypothetical protein